MPELPEVETVRQTLTELLIGRTIEDVWVGWPPMIKEPDDVERFALMLTGQTIRSIGRKGKFLKLYLDDCVLVSHLRMEGKYALKEAGSERTKHTHVVLRFTDGTALHYADVRKFGTMHAFEKGTEDQRPPLSKVGPEPVGKDRITADELGKRLKKTTRAVKAALLDQSLVAGLGNIYVDEALFRAGIHPAVPAHTLPDKMIPVLLSAMADTLQEAIDQGGTSIRSYVNGKGEMGYFQQQLFVYGRTGEPCRKCGTPISRSVVGGRGTHTCEVCQPNRGNQKGERQT